MAELSLKEGVGLFLLLNGYRGEGHLFCKGTGRGALWEKRGNNSIKRGNKRGNN